MCRHEGSGESWGKDWRHSKLKEGRILEEEKADKHEGEREEMRGWTG